MDCPSCGEAMVEQDFGGAMVDFCKNGCKGIWFDWGELTRLDEEHEGLGPALEEALSSPKISDADRGQIACPKCGIPMRIHKYKSAKDVRVDECYGCGGFYLDSGELKAIRDKFITEEEREAYCQQLMNDIPEVQEFKEELAASEERLKAMKKFCVISRMLGRV